MTASYFYILRAEQITDDIVDRGLPQKNGKEKFIYGQFKDLCQYIEDFVNLCNDLECVYDEEDNEINELDFDDQHNKTFKDCLDDIAETYLEVYEKRKNFVLEIMKENNLEPTKENINAYMS